jgi:hypothetical protein
MKLADLPILKAPGKPREDRTQHDHTDEQAHKDKQAESMDSTAALTPPQSVPLGAVA